MRSFHDNYAHDQWLESNNRSFDLESKPYQLGQMLPSITQSRNTVMVPCDLASEHLLSLFLYVLLPHSLSLFLSLSASLSVPVFILPC